MIIIKNERKVTAWCPIISSIIEFNVNLTLRNVSSPLVCHIHTHLLLTYTCFAPRKKNTQEMVPLLLSYLQLSLFILYFGAAQTTALKPNLKDSSYCSDDGFQCGNITYIGYPFWADSRLCGNEPKEDFKLECVNNVTMIKIHSVSYRVLMIDFKSNSLRVARDDLWNTTCPPMPYNTPTPMDFTPYQLDTDDQITTLLFFNCTDVPNPLSLNVSCGVQQYWFNYFSLENPGPNVTCLHRMSVPMNRTKARSALDSSSKDGLQEGLASGFSIRWKNDSKQNKPPFCNLQSDICIPPIKRACLPGLHCRVGDNEALSQSPSPPLLRPPPIQSPPPTQQNSNGILVLKQEIIIVILSVVGGTELFMIIIFWCVKRAQNHRLGRKHDTNLDKVLHQHGLLALNRYSYSRVKKITKSFSEKLGQGGYGSVYKGMLPNGCNVAVKILGETEGDAEGFINEVATISRTSHVNVVYLLGFCYERNKRALIYEYMPNKSLDKFMRDSRSPGAAYSLDLEMLYKISMGVAKGLEYLHSGCNTRIVHFDIKPQNILLDEDLCPKISDFGLAKLCKKKQSVMSLLGTRGTAGYIAPEIYYRNFGRASYKSDVYSYGMMVLEMVGSRNDMETDDAVIQQSSENYFPDQIYEQLMIDITRHLEQGNKTRKLLLVGLWCIQTSPSDRPSMTKVVEMLEGSVEAIQIPPKPLLYYPRLSEEEFSTSVSMYVETEDSTTLE